MTRSGSPRRSRRRVGAVALGLAVLIGCLGRSPTTRLFTLGESETAWQPAPAPELAVYVGPASLPRHLERPQMLRRLPDGELALDERHRWAGGLEANVLRSLGEGLALRLGSDRIVVYPARAPFPIDRELVLDFQELIASDTQLELRVRWVLRSDRDDPQPRTALVTIERPLEGSGPAALVRAHDEALAALADELASRLARDLPSESRDQPEP